MRQEIEKAFKSVIRDQLIQQNKVYIEGLGEFRPEHLSQRKWEYKNGKVVLLPPRDYLEFTDDSQQNKSE